MVNDSKIVTRLLSKAIVIFKASGLQKENGLFDQGWKCISSLCNLLSCKIFPFSCTKKLCSIVALGCVVFVGTYYARKNFPDVINVFLAIML